MDIAIIGAVDLGTRVAALRAAAGDTVTALRRRPLPMPAGVQAVYGDLHDAADLQRLSARPDWLVFCDTPDARNEVAYRRLYVDGLARALRVLQPQRTLFVSSTAVYAQDAGELSGHARHTALQPVATMRGDAGSDALDQAGLIFGYHRQYQMIHVRPHWLRGTRKAQLRSGSQ